MALWDVAMVALIASAVMVLPLAWALLERLMAAQRAIALARARLDELADAIDPGTFPADSAHPGQPTRSQTATRKTPARSRPSPRGCGCPPHR